MSTLNTAAEIIQDIRLGKMVILMDDEDRENEGDVVMAAECVSAEHINFMARYARGLICMPMSRPRCEHLGLNLMAERNGSGFGTKFTTSIEAATGVTTGISAADRARTVQVAAARNAQAQDLVQPGHIFPLIAEPGGVLVRAGHTEAACDLARLAGFVEAGVICEVMNDDGSMARRQDLERFAEQHGLKIGTIADLIHYRAVMETTIERIRSDVVQTAHGEFLLHAYRDRINGDVHLALVRGTLNAQVPTLARVQLTTAVRDLLGVDAPGATGWNLQRCIARIADEGNGAVVMLRHSESSSAVLDAVDVASGRKPLPKPQTPSSNRAFLTIGVGSQILRDLGLGKLRLMGAPVRYNALSGFDLEVTEFVQPTT